MPQIVHPDRVLDEESFSKLSGIDPVYPLTEGLALGSLRRAIAQALQKLPDLPEWISPEVIKRCKFPPIAEALNRVHIPVELTDILPDGPFWSRWRSMNCWRGNWRWRWSAPNCAVLPATATPATATCARRSSTRCPIR